MKTNLKPKKIFRTFSPTTPMSEAIDWITRISRHSRPISCVKEINGHIRVDLILGETAPLSLSKLFSIKGRAK